MTLEHKSKRISCAKRYKIDRKVKEHHRKQRKLAKQNPSSHRKNTDPGIPASWPYKEDVLNEVEVHKITKEEELRKKKEKQLRERQKMSLESMMKDAQRRGDAFNANNANSHGDWDGSRMMKDSSISAKDNSRRAYYHQFRQVVEHSDVLIQVLDARDPLGSRARHAEKFITENAGKRLILLLNKIDLVPKNVSEAWLKYLRREFPTIPFKSSTQSQRSHLGQSKLRVKDAGQDTLQSVSECLGADHLIQLLKNYARNQGIKTVLRVGVVGYPNTGKSSVVNSLKRARVCQVGGRPGVTKSVFEVALDKHLRLLDSPGIVFDRDDGLKKADGTSGLGVLLRNCIKAELIDDPVSPVEVIVSKCNPEQLMLMYTLPRFSTPQEFLVALAQKRGKLKKGGVPDIIASARVVLEDWNSGKIPFYSLPPQDSSTLSDTPAFVNTWSQEFNLSDVVGKDGEVLDQGAGRSNAVPVMVVRSSVDDMIMDDDEYNRLKTVTADFSSEEDNMDVDMDEDDSDSSSSDIMDEDGEAPTAVPINHGIQIGNLRSNKKSEVSKSKISGGKLQNVLTSQEAESNFQINKQRKLQSKQAKKKSNKMNRALDQGGMDIDDAYDFGDYLAGGLPGE